MRYVALLRGINVGGNTMIKMSDLKRVFEDAGFGNVVTYINSGNIAFDSKKSTDSTLLKKLAPAIEALAGRPVKVMFRSREEIAAVLRADPFAGKFESHKHMHVLFLDTEPGPEIAVALKEKETDGEKFIVDGREIYALLADGVANSVLGTGYIDRKLGLTYTARNWRTVQKLAEL